MTPVEEDAAVATARRQAWVAFVGGGLLVAGGVVGVGGRLVAGGEAIWLWTLPGLIAGGLGVLLLAVGVLLRLGIRGRRP